MNVKIKKIKDGTLPSYKREGDVCMDCRSRVHQCIEVGERKLIPLGFALELPEGWEAVIRPRSGLTSTGIDNAIGTIDTNYRGEVKACVINNSYAAIYIEPGDRICQLAIREAPKVEWDVVSELSETNRNDKGFGSTGLK